MEPDSTPPALKPGPKKGGRKKNGSHPPAGGDRSGEEFQEDGRPSPQDGAIPEVGPFDAAFFESQFPSLLAPEGADPAPPPSRPFVVTVVLGDGMVQLDVSHIEQCSDQWVLFAVYDSRGERDGGAPSRFTFVPYAAIARVEVTGVEGRLAPIGFNRKPLDKQGRLKKSSGRKKVFRKTRKKVGKKAGAVTDGNKPRTPARVTKRAAPPE